MGVVFPNSIHNVITNVISFIVATDLSKQIIPSRRKPAPKTPYIPVPSMYLSATVR